MIPADGEWVNSRVLPFAREPLCSIPTLTRTITITIMAMAMSTLTTIIMATRPTSAASASPPC